MSTIITATKVNPPKITAITISAVLFTGAVGIIYTASLPLSLTVAVAFTAVSRVSPIYRLAVICAVCRSPDSCGRENSTVIPLASFRFVKSTLVPSQVMSRFFTIRFIATFTTFNHFIIF